MTASKAWEYRHQLSATGGAPVYKYADKVGSAERLENGNTLVMFGADVDPTTLRVRNPQTFTLVEADASPEASALAAPDMQIPGNIVVYRALPVKTLFGEVACEPDEEDSRGGELMRPGSEKPKIPGCRE
jgi:hypothetical protein